MIYFFYGTDRQAIQGKSRATFDALQAKKPDASFVSYDNETLTLSDLESITGSQGLFEHKIVAKLSDILSNKEIADEVLKMLPVMKASENIIVWSEEEVNKVPLEKIKKNAERADEILEKIKAPKKEFNVFALSDALGAKDRKKLWALLVDAFRRGSAPEEIHGTRWWQLKSIAVAKKTRTADEAGLKPFVYSKAKSFSNNWSEGELQKALSDFVDMYHKAHRGECDFEISLEKFALGV
jgi:DNA polymerase III delta subunit